MTPTMQKLRSLRWINDRFKNCQCNPSYLKNYKKIAPKVARLIRSTGLTIVGKAYHQFDRGYTCVWLLKQSHLSIHSWPEYNFLTVNIEVCNFDKDDTKQADGLYRLLLSLFKPRNFKSRKCLISLRNNKAPR